MLLGIVLHAAIPFVPYYGADDTGGKVLFGLFEYIHLWRMPLFFLISGYFFLNLLLVNVFHQFFSRRLIINNVTIKKLQKCFTFRLDRLG